MKTYTGGFIYTQILEYADANDDHEWSGVKFVKLSDVQDELKEHQEHYKGTKIANFINSFLHGLEIE